MPSTVPRVTRRQAFARLVGGVATLTLAAPVTRSAEAQIGGVEPLAIPPNPRFPTPAAWEGQMKEIATGVYAYIRPGGPGRNNVSISNCGLIVGDDAAMVVDSTTAPMHAKEFIAAIRKVTDKPFRHLLYTHHHGDHVNGGQYFAGAEIVGHPYCRDEVLKAAAAGPDLWAKRDGWAEGTEPRRILPPTTTVEAKTTYRYGKTIVEVLPLVPAHTYGDLVVYLPQHGIMFASDIAFFYVAPFAHNAHPSRWIETCNQIDKMDVQTIVPGHGPLGGKAELADMRGYLVALRNEARQRYDARMSAGAAAADISMGKYDNWVGPERIVMDTHRFYQEFAGTLTPAADVAGIRQATEEYNAARTRRTP